jgi:long-chain acyl-CoA synthetase
MNAIERLQAIPEENNNKVFLVDSVSGRSLTFGELHESSRTVASDLLSRDLNRGDRVAFLLNNSGAFVRALWGSLYAGLVWVPINPALSGDDVEYILESSGARLLVVSPETADVIDLAATQKAGVRVLCLADTRGDKSPPEELDVWDLDDLVPDCDFVPFVGASPDDIIMVIYTSGTTAQPKGVVHRINDHFMNAAAFTKHLGIGPDNRFYCNLALTYIGGCWNLVILPYFTGASVVLSDAFGPTSAFNYWDIARANGVNTLWLVPSIMSLLLELDRGTVGEKLCRESIDIALVGTAPLPAQLRQRFQERYGITVHDNYALSESLFLTTQTPGGAIHDGGSGTLVPGVELGLLNDDGSEVPEGEEGEVSVKTPGLMMGYYDAALQGPNLLPAGEWFRTGDIGTYSPVKGLFITGRKKDVIIRGGLNVSPASVEKVLYEHSGVLECAVVGVPHPHQGEDVVAAVRIDANVDPDTLKREVMALARENLSPVKQPSRVVILDQLPRNATGKIVKDGVRDLVIEAIKAES